MDYKRDKFLKSGSYGSVYKGHDKNGEIIAIKKGFHDNPVSGFGNLKELDFLAKLSKSDFMCKLIDIMTEYEEKNRKQKNQPELLIFVLEYCEGGDCEKFFKDRNKCTPNLYVKFTTQILLGIEFLNFHRVTHRDLKPGNLLIKYNSEGPIIKICDFGFAQVLCNNSTSSPGVVTPWYRAPEILWEIPSYGYTSDLWSVGTIIYEMITGKILLNDISTDTNSDLFNGTISRIPINFSNVDYELYTSLGRISIKIKSRSRKRTFFEEFKLLDEYSYLPKIKWLQFEELLLENFRYDFRFRKSSSECLQLPLFSEEQEYILSNQKIFNDSPELDVIIIKKHKSIYSKKVVIFTEFLDKISSIGMRTMFHSLDLFYQYVNLKIEKDEEIENVEKIIAACIYFFNKYFSTTEYPENPEFFFPYPEGIKEKSDKRQYLKELDKWIFDFEKIIIYDVLDNYIIYRPTLYEMADEYGHELTSEQIILFFNQLLILKKWKDGSYRAMYRDFYHSLINLDYPF